MAQDLQFEAEGDRRASAECGGAIISKGADVQWPKGSFVENSDLWQREWFYITAPRGTKRVAAPAFRSGPPPRLTSWVNEGLARGRLTTVDIANPHPRPSQEGHQSCQDTTSDAGSSSPALPTSSSPYVGVQPRRTANYSAILQHDARRDVWIILRITDKVSGHHRGCGSKLQSSRYPL